MTKILDCTTEKQADVLAAIIGERSFQDKKWGTIEHHPHEVGSWILIMRTLLNNAEIEYTSRRGDIGALDELRKVVAVGVACFEQHGVPSRMPKINLDGYVEAGIDLAKLMQLALYGKNYLTEPTKGAINMQITLPTLNAGEINAGIAMKEDGTPSHWVVLLPNDKPDGNWHDAMQWATEQGGDLPTCQEQSLLFANAKQGFEKDWYWSSQTHDDSSEWAWCQDFNNGLQSFDHRGFYDCRARAVRRVVIE